MKQPKFSRTERLDTKLTDEQIAQIPILRKQGYSFSKIASLFGVSSYPIWKFSLSEERRKEIHKKTYEQRKNNSQYRKQATLASKKAHKRKMDMKAKDMREFHKEQSAEFREKHPNYSTEKSREFRENNPYYAKEWYQRHKSNGRNYNFVKFTGKGKHYAKPALTGQTTAPNAKKITDLRTWLEKEDNVKENKL